MPSPQPLSENLPSAIQVIEDDKKNKSGEFFTGNKGLVPPLVTTNYLVRDEGICSPRFIRSTIYNVPCTADMLKQTNVPFAITISPFARLNENEVCVIQTQPPISDLGELGPVRCNRCKAYMCPYMQFIDGGRRFHCVFCKATTDVPVEYFCHLDHNGMRSDMFTRPELCLGSYEFVATRQYCKAMIIMVGRSWRLLLLPTDENSPRLKVGFVTYSNVVHFYNISWGSVEGWLNCLVFDHYDPEWLQGGAQPKLLTVPDVADMFMPLLTGFLVSLDEAESALDSLLELIPTIFGETKETETILGPVIQAGYEALKAANCAGKLFIFHSSLPIAEAPGKLKNRDDRKLLGTDKEKLGQQCVGVGCCVDLFLFPSAYMDVATLGQVCKLTGGHVYKYQYFQSDVDGEQFLEDLRRDVEQQIGFDAVMRVRTSQGIRPTDFYGHHYMSNTTDIELAGIDSSHALSVQIKYDDKLVDEECAYIQAALLYTSSTGQRRLRIHNLVLPTCNQMADLFRNCEQDTIMNYLAKDCVSKLVDQSSKAIKDKVIALAANMLGCYRKQCANSTSVGQLILPECMKLMPLYVNCLLKSDGISGSAEMLTDDRSLAMYSMGCMSVETSAGYLYPRLLPLHEVNPDSSEMPVALRCSREKVKEEGAYLLENGQLLFLYVGMGISPDWVMAVFNVPSPTHINSEKPIKTNLIEENPPLPEEKGGGGAVTSSLKNLGSAGLADSTL
ncbi:SEC24C [Cordylochernes scorpioides]|uniref:SEC24C n=1 Tax=Cordylochernes scorpioides TaxID=51811 RepID=A0ABY6LE68_9ARAC|nr:SEC24C [Cordylochernes scorpioides]